MPRRSVFLLLLSLVLSLTSCDLFGTSDEGPSRVTTGVYVANQGNFGEGNGSVTVYDPTTGQTNRSAISGLNTIVQDLAVRDTNLYVVANTGARLDVFSTNRLALTGQLTGLDSPRYLTFPKEETAYLSDWGDFGPPSYIRVVDLSPPQPTLRSSIQVSGLPAALTTAGEQVYAALGAFGDTSLVAAIDASKDALLEEIDVGCTPRYLTADRESEVFVLCSNTAEVVLLDGPTGQELDRLTLHDTTSTRGPGQPAHFAPGADELYVVTDSEAVVRIDTEENVVGELLGPFQGAPVGAVAYDALREELYVGRVPGFTERGTVTIHARDGTRTGSFGAGIAPTNIDLRRQEE